MAGCKGCGNKTPLIKEQVLEGGVDFTLNIPKSVYINTHTDSNLSIMQPLISLNHIPQGWQVLVLVNGMTVKVEGSTPYEVVNKCILLFGQNDVKITVDTIWYNCNLQWIKRVAVRHLRVTESALLALKEEQVIKVIPPDILNQGKKLWGGLQAYLTCHSDDFSVEVFNNYLTMLDSYLTGVNGCPDCASHFNDATNDLDIKSLSDARQWLIYTMNLVNNMNNKQLVSVETAYRLNNWIKEDE